MSNILILVCGVLGLVGIVELIKCIVNKEEPKNKGQWVAVFIGAAALVYLARGCAKDMNIYGDNWDPTEMDPR